MTHNSFYQNASNEKKQERENFDDMGGFFPYYEAMHFQSHFYKFHELDENSFYRFDSKQFYIIKKHNAEAQENPTMQNGVSVSANPNGYQPRTSTPPYSAEQKFSLPESLLIKDCLLKRT